MNLTFNAIKKKFSLYCLLFISLLFPLSGLGSVVNAYEYWFDLNFNGYLPNNAKYLYAINLQSRNDSRIGELQRNFSTLNMGYQFWSTVSLWVAYQRISKNYITEVPADNRMIEYALWQVVNESHFTLQLRSRFEQTNRLGQTQWNNRLRERILISFPNILSERIAPVLTDEVFIQLNSPFWAQTYTGIRQNRFQAGLNFQMLPNVSLLLAYMDLYGWFIQNNLNNQIAFISLNFNLN